jgi:hypothetical protein
MKRIIFALGLFCVVACTKSEITNTTPPVNTTPSTPTPPPVVIQDYTINTTSFPLDISGFSAADMNTGIDGSVSGTFLYKQGSIEHLVVSPTLFFYYPLLPALHFIKKNNAWSLEKSYLDGAMGAGRNYENMDTTNGTWAIADFGPELKAGNWPGGGIHVLKTNVESISYKNISATKSFYHSVSVGDLDNNGMKDVVGLNMGTTGNWYGSLHTYLQNLDGTFTEARNFYNDGLNTWSVNKGAGAVLVLDVLGDKRPEIIRGDYGLNTSYQQQSDRYSIVIYSYDNNSGKYDVVKKPGPIGVYSNNDRGTTSIKAGDFDNDGDNDLALATEGTNFNGIEIWNNDGQGNFNPSANKLEFTFEQMQFREFNIIDVDNDGWLDIVMNPFHYGKLFRVGGSGFDKGTGGVYLNNLIWKNNKGNLALLTKQILVPNIKPAYLKGFKINGVFKFVGFETNGSSNVQLHEIGVNL